MSRYMKEGTFKFGGKKKKCMFVWGHDRPTMEYFFQCFDLEAEEDEPDVLFSIGSHLTLTCHPDFPRKMDWSNAEMLVLMSKYKDIVPADHRKMIMWDQPF